MKELVLLTHRIPWPPDKGDKIRSAQLLRHLAQTHRVHLATFIDDPRDLAHIDRVRAMAGGDCLFRRLSPLTGKIASLAGLLTGEALSRRYYDDRAIDRWLRRILDEHRPEAVVAFSSTMAQYVLRVEASSPVTILDMVDVDSAKFRQYAEKRAGLRRWIYAREALKLGEEERRAARRFDHTVFAAAAETALFARLAPDLASHLSTITNGVDQNWFEPNAEWPSPYDGGAPRILFTGVMDYPPNLEAATWFMNHALPAIVERWPGAKFWVVGANPPSRLRGLARRDVSVTGRVPDMRPYLAHADLVVAPMLTARGVQNKILEAMAMARPVVTTPEAAQGLAAIDGRDLIVASPEGFSTAALALLADQPAATALGENGRRYVAANHVWSEVLKGFDRLLQRAPAEAVA